MLSKRSCTAGARAGGGGDGGGGGEGGVCSLSTLRLMAVCCFFCLLQETESLLLENGTFAFCGTSPEMSALRSTNSIEGGFDTLRQVERQPCSEVRGEDRRYRTYDGTCNARDDLGAAFSRVKRFTKPYYEGTDSRPRDTAKSGRKLPSARAVSVAVHSPKVRDSPFSLMLMQFGQFLDHDISLVPIATEFDGSIRCCGVPEDELYIDCYPIGIPEGDRRFKDCMEFVRSDAVTFPNGTVPNPRTHQNVITAFLDASHIYGSDRVTAKSLRSRNGTGALLATRMYEGQERLPTGHEGDCVNVDDSHFCALAGDERVNEQPGLTAIHTVFHMEHNRLVRKLTRVVLYRTRRSFSNFHVEQYLQTAPDSVQERMYQVVRKVMGAMWQNIVYDEYLPQVLGPRIMSKYGLWTGRRAEFDPGVDPSIAEEFLASAFRFGHTLVNDMMLTDEMRAMRDLFTVSGHALNNFNNIVQGLVTNVNNAEKFDTHLASSLTDHLFETEDNPGLDLASLNIQRGRDHGLPRINELRQHFGLKKISRWQDFGDVWQQMRAVYEHPDDVDSFTGGTAERSVEGGVVGETFAHVLGQQFRDLKFGDRYFFETDNVFFGFQGFEMRSIKRHCFSKILCENAGLQRIQKNPFRHPDRETNRERRCSDYADIDMWYWSDYVLGA